MNTTNLIYLSLGLSILLLLLIIWQAIKLYKLEQVRKEFFASGLKKDFEQVLVDQNRGITKINQELKELDESLTRLYKDNRQNIQKVGFMRFNPFDDAGGNISFTLALLNAQDDGVVISSLHGREGTRTYAKSVRAGLSESKLTEEETEAIKQAK
ncbi:MAG TPA: DUF4446 family protein [Methylomirabilota bacterium]|jgi:hypothetical protein|nr:DUF4446 family protein [Methylomirabilota bacterium]